MAKMTPAHGYDPDMDDDDEDDDVCIHGLVGGQCTYPTTYAQDEDDGWMPESIESKLSTERPKVLGELDHNQFHTAREGTREMGRQGSSGLRDEFHTAREGTRR